MLSCREVTRRASDYLDRELSLRQQLAIRLHLLLCASCRRLVHRLRLVAATLARLAAIGAPPPDAATIDRFLAQLPTTRDPRAGMADRDAPDAH